MKPLIGAALVALAVLTAPVVAAPAARAFTLDTQSDDAAGTSGFTNPNRSEDAFSDRPTSSRSRSRSDLADPTRDPKLLPPVPQGARIGAGEYGFGNNSRFGYDRSGRPR